MVLFSPPSNPGDDRPQGKLAPQKRGELCHAVSGPLSAPVEKPFSLPVVDSQADRLVQQSIELTGPLVPPTDRSVTLEVNSDERQHMAMPIVNMTCGLMLIFGLIHGAACFNPNIKTQPVHDFLAEPVSIGFFGLSVTMVGFTFATQRPKKK
jgi:hypothetical protein